MTTSLGSPVYAWNRFSLLAFGSWLTLKAMAKATAQSRRKVPWAGATLLKPTPNEENEQHEKAALKTKKSGIGNTEENEKRNQIQSQTSMWRDRINLNASNSGE